MSSVKIRPATIADKDAIFRVHYEALKRYHEFYAALYISHPKDFMIALTERALNNPDHFFLGAELDGSLVGFIRYSVVEVTPPQPTNSKEGNGNNDNGAIHQPPPPLVATKDHLKDLWERFNERDAEMDACKEQAIKGQRHYYVWHLMIDPNHQRKGIGMKLLRSVAQKADADGVATLIVSSAESHGLYLKAGFEDLGTWVIDNEYWAKEIVKQEKSLGIKGNDGLESRYSGVTEVEACMIRKP